MLAQRQREREGEIFIDIYIYVYIYMYISLSLSLSLSLCGRWKISQLAQKAYELALAAVGFLRKDKGPVHAESTRVYTQPAGKAWSTLMCLQHES